MKIKRNILLNPGPATTTNSVKFAQIVPDICPRENEFGRLLRKVSNDLTSFVGNKNEYSTVLFGGSGTASVESILTSVIPNKGKVIIINNGSYGNRMCEISLRYKIKFIEFKSSKTSPIDLTDLEETIKNSSNLTHIAAVHNETTTGLLNNLTLISKLAKKYKLIMIVDAMSSYGAIPIDMKKLNISYLAASSNKNIQGIAGISFVIAKTKCLRDLKNVTQQSYYLSLREQFEYFEKNNQTRFTPPVQVLYALNQAIEELKKETIKERYNRYAKSWETLIKGIKKLGLNHIVDKKNHSKIITAIELPNEINFEDLHDFLFLNNITIYPGKIREQNTFRIANIGDINHNDIKVFLQYLEKYLTKVSNG
jgi:2-aminoethylphosphonate-pyruvate transaminase